MLLCSELLMPLLFSHFIFEVKINIKKEIMCIGAVPL